MGKTKGLVIPFKHGETRLEGVCDDVGRMTVQLAEGEEGKAADLALDFCRGKQRGGYIAVMGQSDARRMLTGLGATLEPWDWIAERL